MFTAFMPVAPVYKAPPRRIRATVGLSVNDLSPPAGSRACKQQ